jgi:YegS/Rv2252/BmrU family lipid kinase
MLAIVRKAVANEVPVVIAGGGDGTLSAVANILIGTGSALGVLPLGTGNAFARDLGIPIDAAAACEVVSSGKIACLDVGIANGSCFLNVATVGLSTAIAASLREPSKRRFGRVVYAFAVARAFVHIRPFRATLKTENGTHTFQSLQIVIGNGRYHAGPFRVAPDASLTTGKLSLYALDSAKKSSLIRLALHLPSASHVVLPEVHSEAASSGELTTEPRRRVTLDGEIGLYTPLRFEVRPGALRTVVPFEFAD